MMLTILYLFWDGLSEAGEAPVYSGRLEYTLPDNRLKFTLPDSRMKYTVTE
jgi:hypothetical protein